MSAVSFVFSKVAAKNASNEKRERLKNTVFSDQGRKSIPSYRNRA